MDSIIDITSAIFWSKVSVTQPTLCWEWRGHKNHFGYGVYQHKKAHRTAYELCVGPIPQGLCIRHKCDNPSCVNPYHLEPGSIADNHRDMVERGRMNPPIGEAHGRCKFSDAQIREIRTSQETGKDIAVRLGCAESTISYIRRGLRRQNVK